MGDTICYSYSQSCFGPGLGEIRNIKWSILIGGSSTEKGGTTSFGVQCSMRGAVCQCICSSLEDSWGGLDGITIDYTFHHNTSLQCMPCWLVWLQFISEKKASPSILCYASAITDACRDFLVLATIVLGSFGSVHSSACSAQLFQNHRIQFWDHFLKSWCAKVAKAVLEVHILQLSHRSGRKSRFARQPVMGHLMVMMSLKLCNSNCFVSRCTQKIDPLFEDSEDMQNIFTKGHMKSSLDGRPSTFSDSSFGTVCLFLFNNTSGIFCVCSLKCLLSTITPESQDSVLGPFSKNQGAR